MSVADVSVPPDLEDTVFLTEKVSTLAVGAKKGQPFSVGCPIYFMRWPYPYPDILRYPGADILEPDVKFAYVFAFLAVLHDDYVTAQFVFHYHFVFEFGV